MALDDLLKRIGTVCTILPEAHNSKYDIGAKVVIESVSGDNDWDHPDHWECLLIRYIDGWRKGTRRVLHFSKVVPVDVE